MSQRHVKIRLYCEVPTGELDRHGEPQWHEYAFEASAVVSNGSPGRINGPPEDCYPEEPAEVEWCDEVVCMGPTGGLYAGDHSVGHVWDRQSFETLMTWERSILGTSPGDVRGPYRLSDDDEMAFDSAANADDYAPDSY